MKQASLQLGHACLVADPSGALVWPDHALVVVADLHLEKGSALAGRGILLPPYDTRTTLAALADTLARWTPRTVISLGDGFHDDRASERLAASDRTHLRTLVAAHEWIWLAGNHDPAPPAGLGGRSATELEIGGIRFRHRPASTPDGPEIAGHLHPCARVTVRGRRLTRPCFVHDRRRVLLPAFGSYTGGLDVLDPAIAGLFEPDFAVALLGQGRVHPLPCARLHRTDRLTR